MKDQVKVKWILQKLRYITTINLNSQFSDIESSDNLQFKPSFSAH